MAHTVRLFFDDGHEAQISCRPGEDVITAALREGLILMSECRAGACSSCKCFLADGDYDDLLAHSVYALSSAEEDAGFVLACRLRPRSDMELEFDYPYAMVHKFEETVRKGSIDRIEMVSDTVARLVVRTLTAQEPLDYLPGQFARLTMGDGISRAFSMANPPSRSRRLEFLVRIYPDGRFSRYLTRHARPGTRVTVEGPRGTFVLRDGERTPVFIAGGTGLAPVLAMLRHLATTDPRRHALLLFGNANPDDVFCADELDDLQDRMPNLDVRTCVVDPDPTWTGETGLVTDVAERVLDRAVAYEYYYSGPLVMVAAVTRLLERLGVARDHRHHEDFVPSGAEHDDG